MMLDFGVSCAGWDLPQKLDFKRRCAEPHGWEILREKRGRLVGNTRKNFADGDETSPSAGEFGSTYVEYLYLKPFEILGEWVWTRRWSLT
jgi:hypothetical protein